MSETLLTQQQLAERWGVSPETLANWRTRRTGPPYIRLRGSNGPIRYRLVDIEAYERQQTIETSSEASA